MTVNTAIKCYEPIGVSFYTTDTSPQFRVGTRAKGENGTTWMYVQAVSAVKQFDAVSLDELYTQIASLTNANAKKSYMVGWAQNAIAAASYGWVCINGSGIQGRVKAVLNHSVKVYCPATSSGSAGVLRASATGRYKIQGVVTVTTASGSAKSPELELSWPVILGG